MNIRKVTSCVRFDFGKLIKSFQNAGNGFIEAVSLRNGQNLRIHCVSAACVVVLGFSIQMPTSELAILILLSFLVISAELMNSAIEILCDYACNGKWDERIRQVKDFSAASVLVLAVCSVVIACLIIVPAMLS